MIQYDDTTLRSSTRIAAAGTFIRFFQTIFENTSLWRLKCLVTLSTYRRYINKYIYLSIYYTIDTLTKYQAKQNHSIMPLAAYIETRLVVSQQYSGDSEISEGGGIWRPHLQMSKDYHEMTQRTVNHAYCIIKLLKHSSTHSD